jgi:DNA repair protein RadC
MAVAGVGELGAIPGVGIAAACRVKAALALAGRLSGRPFQRGEVLSDASVVFDRVGRRLVDLDREHFIGIALDVRGHVLTELRFAEGSGCSVEFQPRDVFATLLREGAASVIFVHNHPSGDPEPSEIDRRLTQRLRRAGVLIGLRVIDHIVVARGGFQSILQPPKGARVFP